MLFEKGVLISKFELPFSSKVSNSFSDFVYILLQIFNFVAQLKIFLVCFRQNFFLVIILFLEGSHNFFLNFKIILHLLQFLPQNSSSFCKLDYITFDLGQFLLCGHFLFLFLNFVFDCFKSLLGNFYFRLEFVVYYHLFVLFYLVQLGCKEVFYQVVDFIFYFCYFLFGFCNFYIFYVIVGVGIQLTAHSFRKFLLCISRYFFFLLFGIWIFSSTRVCGR